MKTYKGTNNHIVTVDGEPLPLCTNIVNHSPTGFSWGYEGSGAAQLALAILVSEYGDDLDKHPVFYQEFKRGVIAALKEDNFVLSSHDIEAFVTNSYIP